MPKTDEKKKETNKPSGGKGKGYIAGTNFPIRTAHNEKNGEFALLNRRKQVTEMYLRGWSQWDIANEVGVNQSVVHEDIRYMHREWLSSIVEQIDEVKTRDLAKLDMVENEMWKAYLKSCTVEEIVTLSAKTERVAVFDGEGKDKKYIGHEMVETETTRDVRTKVLIGDTRYMDEILKCIDMRGKILGYTKDDKKGDNNTVVNVQWDRIEKWSGAEEIEAVIASIENEPPLQLNAVNSPEAETV